MSATAQAPPAALEVEALSRRFGGVLAVDNVSFAVAPGEIFGLIGPNGAGKTTLFNLVTGITRPTSGRFLHGGKDLTGFRPYQIARRGLARTFQNVRLFAGLSALENVMIGRHCRTRSGLVGGVLGIGTSRAEELATRQRSLELLALVGLERLAKATAGELSYGDQRRLEIARALATEPAVLLLDEPAAGMNPHERATLGEFIAEVRNTFDLTVVLIEHHVPLVMGLCGRIAVLDFGRLIALGPPEAVRNDPAVIDAYLGEA